MENDHRIKWGEIMDGVLLDQWPRDENGEPEEPVFLCSLPSVNLSDQMLMNMLQAYGIPCLSMERGNGNLGRIYLGISGYGTDLYVPKSLLDDAEQLCEEENNEEL